MASQSPSTILVTGAGGFIGSAVVLELTARGAGVTALLGPPGANANAPPAGVVSAYADIRDQRALSGCLEGAQIVVHVAGRASVHESFAEPADYASMHVVGTATLLEASRRAGARRFVYVSSAEVHGRPESNPVREDHPVAARSPYGAAKAAAEQFVQAYMRSSGIDTVILRPFSIYGPRLSLDSLVGSILSQARLGDEIRVFDSRPVRDYCYVSDLARAVANACSERVPSCVVNVGSGAGVSVAEIVHVASGVLGRPLRVEETSARQRSQQAEILRLIADPSRAASALGWSAQTTLEDGLKATLAWLEQSTAS